MQQGRVLKTTRWTKQSLHARSDCVKDLRSIQPSEIFQAASRLTNSIPNVNSRDASHLPSLACHAQRSNGSDSHANARARVSKRMTKQIVSSGLLPTLGLSRKPSGGGSGGDVATVAAGQSRMHSPHDRIHNPLKTVPVKDWALDAGDGTVVRSLYPPFALAELGKLTKRAAHTVAVVSMNGWNASSSSGTTTRSLPALTVLMKPKKQSDKHRTSTSSEIPTETILGTPRGLNRAFLNGSQVLFNRNDGQSKKEDVSARLARNANDHWAATEDYTATDKDELSCFRGDSFRSVQPTTDGWVEGAAVNSGEIGALPAHVIKSNSRLQSEQKLEAERLEAERLSAERSAKTTNPTTSIKLRNLWERAVNTVVFQVQTLKEQEHAMFEKWRETIREALQKKKQEAKDHEKKRNPAVTTIAPETKRPLTLENGLTDEDVEREPKKKPSKVLLRLPKTKRKPLSLPTRSKFKAGVEKVQQEENPLLEFAAETMSGGRQLHEFIWQKRCGHDLNANVTKEELVCCLRMVNDLITEDQIKFCLLALDMVAATMHDAHFDFKMFCVVAALSKKVSSLGGVMGSAMDRIDFSNGQALELKILKARKLFYLAENTMETGSMSFEDLEHVFLAGGTDMEVADELVDSLLAAGKTEVEFLDFLSYLPLFIEANQNIRQNPLSQINASKRMSIVRPQVRDLVGAKNENEHGSSLLLSKFKQVKE